MLEVVVTRKESVAQDICAYELALADGGALPPFSAGSHIDVHVTDRVVRQYSLCNHPDERTRYVIGVLREPQSRGGSIAMHEQVRQGSRLLISEPRNHFPLAHDARRSILFAGGIGITPILCMAERLSHVGADFELHYCARSLERMAFRDRILASGFSRRVHLHLDDGLDVQKLRVDAVLAKPEPDVHLYVCGPGGYMEHVLGAARRLGWPEPQVHREYFAAAPGVGAASDGVFEVRIASSGKSYVIPKGRSVTQVLEAGGVEIPVSCESGVCGTCLTRVIEGEPDHRDSILTDEERARNDQFTPCCSRSKSAVLVLDL